MNTNHDALREALKSASDFIEDVHAGEWSGGPHRRNQVLKKLEIAMGALSQPMPEAAAQGWKLVPVEPTEEMQRAAQWVSYTTNGGYAELYKAMLSASPAAPEGAKPEHKAMPFGERTPALMTYENQPGNVGAWRLGEACAKAAAERAGDYIDRGLVLLRELQSQGYGVVHLDAAQPPHSQPQAQSATLRQCANPDSAGADRVKVGIVMAHACQSCGAPATRYIPDEATEYPGPYCDECGPGATATKCAGDPGECAFNGACMYRCGRLDPPQPQAQGEPLQGLSSYLRAIATNDLIYGSDAYQTHMQWVKEIESHREAIAKRDAALVAGVEAARGLIEVIHAAGLQNLTNGVQLGATVWFVKATDALTSLDAAITQANEVLGRKEGVV